MRFLVAILSAQAALAGLVLPSLAQGQDNARRYVAVRWDSVGVIAAGDSVVNLYNPLSIAAFGDSVAIVDYGDSKVKCFTKAGALTGAFGREGHGPWEVSGLTGVVLGADGLLWVGDRGNSRAYALMHTCQPRAQITLSSVPHRVFGLDDGRLLTLGVLDSAPLVHDSVSSVHSTLPLIPAAQQAHPLIRNDVEVVALLGGGFAAVYLYGSWLAIYSSDGGVRGIPTPDRQAFPPLRRWKVSGDAARVGPDPSTRRLANGIATDGKRIFVLSPGLSASDRDAGLRDADFGTSVDVYSIADAKYLESWRLPRTARTIAWGGGLMVLLSRDPEPAITFWRPNEPVR